MYIIIVVTRFISDTDYMEIIIRFFSYSLERRIIPRHEVMVENRVNFKLRYMLASTDTEFDQRVQAAVERRRKFELGIMDEQASESQGDGFSERILVDTGGHDYPYSDSETSEQSYQLDNEEYQS